jgi:L-rhamnose mutarotase
MKTHLKNTCTILLLAVLVGCTAPQPKVTRYAWVTGLKADKIERYESLHANPWPGVMKMLKECNIQNYSIHKREIGGKTYLFSYLEYTGSNFAADMKKMATDPETQRWWKETDPCQAPLPDAAAQGKIWSDCEEVFYLK